MVKKLLIALALFLGLPIVGGIVMVVLGIEVKDSNPEKTKELHAKITKRLSVLDEIAHSDQASWGTEKPCPTGLFDSTKKVEVLSYEQVRDYLRLEFDQSIAANDSIYDLVSLKLTSLDQRVTESTHITTLESILSGGGLNYGHVATIYGAKLLAVVRSESLMEPKTGVKFTGKFHGGAYKGNVRVVDVENKELLCQVPFVVQSSDEIDKGLLKRADSAIQADFERQMVAGKKKVETKLGGAPLAW